LIILWLVAVEEQALVRVVEVALAGIELVLL
jgi:hypothetical protein